MNHFPKHVEVVARLREGLHRRQRRVLGTEGARAAAVALLLADRDGETYVPFTVRAATLREHSGQISLPGGVRDQVDVSFAAAALRETEEELGIAADRVDVLGLLDDMPTPTGFVITPVLAELHGASYEPSPREVAEVFEAPLSLFVDPTAVEHMGQRQYFGHTYELRAYHYGSHRIWGATARIVEYALALLSLGPFPTPEHSVTKDTSSAV